MCLHKYVRGYIRRACHMAQGKRKHHIAHCMECVYPAYLPACPPSIAFPQPGYFPCILPFGLSLCVHTYLHRQVRMYHRRWLRRSAPDSIARPPPCHVPSCPVLPGISTAPGALITSCSLLQPEASKQKTSSQINPPGGWIPPALYQITTESWRFLTPCLSTEYSVFQALKRRHRSGSLKTRPNPLLHYL